MFIYLAQPIDQAGTNQALAKVVNSIHDAALGQGHSLFRPAQAYRLSPPPWDEHTTTIVDQINTDAIRSMDGIIAVLLPDVPTLGTVSEIELALKLCIPICIVTTEELRQRSVQLASWVRQGAQVVFCGPTGFLSGFDVRVALAAEPVRELLDTSTFGGQPSFTEGRAVQAGDLQVVYMDPAAKPLTRAHSTDAGLDLATLEPATLDHGVRTLIRTGVMAPPPEGWWGLIKARSSTQKRGIQVNEAVIDAGYQGELMISVTLVDQGRSRIEIEAGSRLAQYILVPAFTGKVARVSQFAPSLRGDRGWGSSGE